MNKLIVVSVVMAVALLTGIAFAPAQPQEPTNKEKPTFYRLVPGTYVNGWPRFTIHYPKEWVEKHPIFTEVFRAEAPASTQRSVLSVNVFPNPHPVDKLADVIVQFYRVYVQDLTIVSNKPTRLLDGTPAWEVESKMVMNGEPIKTLNVATKKGDMWVNTGTRSHSGKIEEYQRAMLYSLQYEPGKDEPVKVPFDIQEFLDKWCSAQVAHDLAKLMTHYSDRYLNSGVRKGEMERVWRQTIGLITSAEVGITELVLAGDTIYLAGFLNSYRGKVMLIETSIINENGEWKWYGNQRDPSP